MIEPISQSALPDVPPRSQILLRDPVAYYLDGLAKSSRIEMRRQLARISRLIGYPSVDSVPWENLRLPR